ncbi:hypothetical protein FHX81_6448 [Saccharothrix saharensis]|uniref:Uncharacterized protein n=1 Tax=Saccharothrix saharensis TaxID=571190 RepID=A0A543JME6_9PSEU|nr:hypothetical protein [Saccharothrix saharensis]TQM84011.1 hypothetical protein FHX81_6448 [Saccharothrix saharensis]
MGLSGGGLRAVTEADGTRLVLAEVVDGRRHLVTVEAEPVWTSDPLVHDGERVTHVVRDGVATPTSTTPVLAERNAPAHQVDPAARG